MNLLRKLYDWVFSLARSRHATPALAVVSFAESSVFPIPPDVMLAPMIIARPERAYFYAAVCTIASVLGGILGYAIGYFLTDVGLASSPSSARPTPMRRPRPCSTSGAPGSSSPRA